MIDVTGWLSVITAALALSFGGSITGYGVQVGAVISGDGVMVGVTPITVWSVERVNISSIEAVTLGGTVVLFGDRRYWRGDGLREVMSYEFGHVDGWTRYGLEYPLAILRNPCAFDPAAFRSGSPFGYAAGRCDTTARSLEGVSLPLPKHYAFALTIQ